MAIQTKITVQQMMLKESGDYRVGKYPRYIITLGNSLSSVTVEELATAVANANAAANAAAASQTAAKTSETNSKASETAANNSKNAAAASQTAAKTSETNSKASETAAKTSETNSKTSENAAKASQTAAKTSETNAATSAQTALDALQGIKDAQDQSPFPDFWLPLNDSLQLLAGFSPYDRIYMGSQYAELTSKSVPFTRNSSATYIDKSGTLQMAVNNEPRFEKDGLLLEGQSTNYILNSEAPLSWSGTVGSLTKTVINADGATKATTCKVVTTSSGSNFQLVQSSAIDTVSGDTLTISCRFKSDPSTTRVLLRFDSPSGTNQGQVLVGPDGATGTPNSPNIISVTNTLLPDGYCYASATLKAAVDGGHFGRIYFMPAGGTLPAGVEGYFQTVQCEKNAIATSYIPTGASAASRAGDQLNIQVQGNIGYDKLGDTFARTFAFEFSVDRFLQPLTGAAYVDFVAAAGARNDIWARGVSNKIISYRGSGGVDLNVTYPFRRKMYAQTIDVANNNTVTGYFDGTSASRSAQVPTDSNSSPTVLRFNSHTNAVYHIRNLRIWHQVLTSNQIKGLK